MGTRIAREVAGEVFRTTAELERKIKSILDGVPINLKFTQPFLAAVINTYHDEVIAAGQRASGEFEYLTWQEQTRRGYPTAERFRGGKLMMGFFEPLCDWRDVTVYPWKKSDDRQEVKRALREKVSRMLPHPSQTDRCDVLGCSKAGSDLEYHHVSPTFDEMAEIAIQHCTDEEVQCRFGYSKFKRGTFTVADFIPNDHRAIRLLMEMHEQNEWQWLCKFHHRNVQE